jgi:hypothetical protein
VATEVAKSLVTRRAQVRPTPPPTSTTVALGTRSGGQLGLRRAHPRNNGTSDSQNVSLVANSSLFSMYPPTVTASSGGTCLVSQTNVTCKWGTLAAAATSTAVITVRPEPRN